MSYEYSFWSILTKGYQRIENNEPKEEIALVVPDKIVIPIIQRDYVQGKPGERATAVRERFLSSILNALQGEKLDLNFIYGSTSTSNETVEIELIDGQQRFTTLFLVHWFLARATNNTDAMPTLKKFSYRTRSSSEKFCELLCEKAETISLELEEEISSQVKDAVWFLEEWEHDPTVAAMLNMLDSIQKEKSFRENCTEKWNRLTGEESCIVFQFLVVDSYGDSEDLYIKMNSRGKPLTDFENFKALFGKRLADIDDLRERGIHDDYWHNIDGDWSKHFWDFILQRYQDKHVPKDQWLYSIDETIMKYIWLQVEMYSSAFNENAEEFSDFYKDKNANTPKMDFERIDSSSQRNYNDWNNQSIREKHPEELIVASLERSDRVLELIRKLLSKEDGVNCWIASPIDNVFPLYHYKIDEEKKTKSIEIWSGTGKCDYFMRIMVFTIIFWCSAFGVSGENEEKRLCGYLRVVRNCLKRYRSKKSAARFWDPELGKKECGKIVRFITEQLLNPDRDCFDQIADLDDTLFISDRFRQEKQKINQFYKRYSRDQIAACYQLEDTELLQGSLMPLLKDDGPIIAPDECKLLFSTENYRTLSKALIASSSTDGQDTVFFKIPSGEKNNNKDRIALFDNDPKAWSVALLYRDEFNFSENNAKALEKLIRNIRERINQEHSSTIEAAQKISEEYIQNHNYSKWQYYFIKYFDCFFNTGGMVLFGNGKELPEAPAIKDPEVEKFACATSYNNSRWSDMYTANVYIIMAVVKLCKEKGIDLKDNFKAGQVCELKKADKTCIRIEYKEDGQAFNVSDERVIPNENEDLVEKLSATIESLL